MITLEQAEERVKGFIKKRWLNDPEIRGIESNGNSWIATGEFKLQ